MKLSLILLISVSIMLTSCISAPVNRMSDEYASYSCPQLQQELALVNGKLNEISDQQVQNRIVGGAMSMIGYSVTDAPTDEDQLPELKRRQDRLQHALIARDCYAGR